MNDIVQRAERAATAIITEMGILTPVEYATLHAAVAAAYLEGWGRGLRGWREILEEDLDALSDPSDAEIRHE